MRNRARVILVIVSYLLLSACAALAPTSRATRGSDSDSRVQRCEAWFEQLDATIDRAGVRDAGQYRIKGFPYLRADRFTASLREEAAANDDSFALWLARLRDLDAQARGFELANLPDERLAELGVPDKDAAGVATRECADALAAADLASRPQRNAVIARAVVPDDYSTWKRAAGLYPIASIAFARGIAGWHREAHALFKAAKQSDGQGLVRYAPAEPRAATSEVRALFSGMRYDRLGVPQLDAAQEEALLRAYAPVFEIENQGEHDRFGALRWADGRSPQVDTSRPIVYERVAFTRYGADTLVQLVYTLWFPERPLKNSFDLLGGRLDGVVWRVTLGRDGAALLFDTIHACGCYHMFFPTARVEAIPAADPRSEWAFIPATLPELTPGARIAVRIASATHYVIGVRPSLSDQATRYDFAAEDTLRALPIGSGATRSVFAPSGLIAGTERGERWLFWPMGIRSAGAMRQWGKHATAFVGRRHFDDARLIEQRFALRQAGD